MVPSSLVVKWVTLVFIYYKTVRPNHATMCLNWVSSLHVATYAHANTLPCTHKIHLYTDSNQLWDMTTRHSFFSLLTSRP